jgi:2-C-methyl-D-erythritol 4-phosphate cytidylyltransferase
VIERAYREASEADRVATDDAALCENIGLSVVVVRGSERAVKITEENDFALAEALSIFRE